MRSPRRRKRRRAPVPGEPDDATRRIGWFLWLLVAIVVVATLLSARWPSAGSG